MNPVPFDHKAHENYNGSCIVCHHASLDACAQCHTQKGSRDGQFIRIEGAMHMRDERQSCLGCHANNQQKPECAACHSFMAENPEGGPQTCRACHMDPLQETMGTFMPNDPNHAKKLLESRTDTTSTFDTDDIPEKVKINELSEKYDPVEFPHRKIVETLMKNIKDNKLALYFHPDKGTICQGCHHNSPASKKPPRCGSCHGTPFDERNAFRPGLKGAFHQQCMGCHEVLKMVKPASTACTDCHKEKPPHKKIG
jgi:hypothetical protein